MPIRRPFQGLIQEIALRSVLSFGPDCPPIRLGRLNVLIGPNGSGKSNLIDCIDFLRSTPRDEDHDARQVARAAGGIVEWIWKGTSNGVASIDWVVRPEKGNNSLRHRFSFRMDGQSFRLDDERIENERPADGEDDAFFYYRFQKGRPAVNSSQGGERRLSKESIDVGRSILAQRDDRELYPELWWLKQNYSKIRIYRDWSFGRNSVLRQPGPVGSRNDILDEDFSNLGLYLNRIRTRFPKVKKAIIAGLRDLYDGITDFDVLIEGGTAQIYFTEGDYSIPASRLSDGTLRYLCLLSILCNPEPMPLICIEEPEIGLHPDIVPKIADLLKSASERTQIIVTTHSDLLVDAMTESPEAVHVCSKDEHGTVMKRLSREDLAVWLESYRLGELWTKGEIGGTRW